MSTRSNIVLQRENEWAVYYHHADGYPSHMVPILMAARNFLVADPDFETTKARFLAGVNLTERAWYAFDHDPKQVARQRKACEAGESRPDPCLDANQFSESEFGLGEGPPDYIYRVRIFGERLIEVCAGNGRQAWKGWDEEGEDHGFKDPGLLTWHVVMPGDDLQRLQEDIDNE